MTVGDIINGMMTYGCGTLLGKLDMKSVYWNVAVHAEDWYLLGMQWHGRYLVEMALPFGLRSAPFIFSQ